MRLTYANVVSTLALFLVLTGGAAYAAHRYLTRKSVGTPQLKANAVTTAKIKANAITTRKIKKIAVSSAKLKEGAVTTEKLFDEAVTGEKIDLESTPFARVVARMRGSSSLVVKPLEYVVYPLAPPTYTQAADELDSYAGEVGVTIPAKCTAPRTVAAKIVVDAEDPAKPTEAEIYAAGGIVDEGVGAVSRTVELSPSDKQSIKFEPGKATKRTVDLIVEVGCGGGSGTTVTSGAVDVIATR
jgi:methionine-rich copper-binding protein CopC